MKQILKRKAASGNIESSRVLNTTEKLSVDIFVMDIPGETVLVEWWVQRLG